MREKLMRKCPLNNEDYLLGWTSIMAPSCSSANGKVYKLLEVHTHHPLQQSDLHFFEYVEEKWILLQENSYINLEGDPRLIDMYQNLPRAEAIEFETFIRLIFYSLYGL